MGKFLPFKGEQIPIDDSQLENVSPDSIGEVYRITKLSEILLKKFTTGQFSNLETLKFFSTRLLYLRFFLSPSRCWF